MYMVIDSEYCSMGRWISVIVAESLKMKLYEGKDLIKLVDQDWLSEEDLEIFDNNLRNKTVEELLKDEHFHKITTLINKGIEKAISLGPCIIHERAAYLVLKDKVDYVSVLLFNRNKLSKLPRAINDKSYDLQGKSNEYVYNFMDLEDNKRRVYRNALTNEKWGERDSYDICLDSDKLSREKCAEILIETLKEVSIDIDKCNDIIKKSFSWSR